eukprot:TRINITY_DN17552_c0_g1_i1.p1 TRINITY_DN17552_c0_g1~~TRINITY_DN17552_c0_g1_i1.p1  ORF type:complete len:141 (+),score=6.71 TRINITY_DN17552_c0_g1_i1:41-424(+)
MKDLAALIMNRLHEVRPITELQLIEPLNFKDFIATYLGESSFNDPKNEVLWFQFRFVRDWLEEKFSKLTEDINKKKKDPQVQAKYLNNSSLLNVVLKRYWNTVSTRLNEQTKKEFIALRVKPSRILN